MGSSATLDGPGTCGQCGRLNPPDCNFCAGCGTPLASGELAMPSPEADPLIGRVVADRYRLLEVIGRGGMGVVYKVEHVHIGKFMAMKLLHGELARDRDSIRRFRREASAASTLDHPNTVEIYDHGEHDGLIYLVMEYLAGEELATLIKTAPLELGELAPLIIQACNSVGEAHANGIVHRDIKPENIMVIPSDDGKTVVKVLDFGLAKLRHADGGASMTKAGAILGTPYYMSPEQIRGEEIDARSDVYSMGATMYKALTGAPPFWAPSPVSVLTKHLSEPVVPPSERVDRNMPRAADAIVCKCLEKEPANRYPSMRALADDLLTWLSDEGVSFDNTVLRPSGVDLAPLRPARSATRAEVDNYERNIRRRGLFFYGLGALALLGVGFGAYRVWDRFKPTELSSVEVEPNNDPQHANELPPDFPVRAQLGRRLSLSHSDADVYRLKLDQRAEVDIQVSRLPGIDLVVDLVQAGASTPLIQANVGAVGEAERLPNVSLTPGTWYVRVRERYVHGQTPSESLSDDYTVSYSFRPPVEGFEHEPNDSLELASPISLGRVEGLIGWNGDRDTYCIEGETHVRASLSAPPGLDLILRIANRSSGQSRSMDDARAGAVEKITMEPSATEAQFCFEVAVSSEPAPEGTVVREAEPDTPYALVVEAVTP